MAAACLRDLRALRVLGDEAAAAAAAHLPLLVRGHVGSGADPVRGWARLPPGDGSRDAQGPERSAAPGARAAEDRASGWR